MSEKVLESPYVSFTELLAGSFLIFIVMIVYLAINQGEDERVVAGFLRDIESLQEQRLDLAFTVIEAEAAFVEAERRQEELQIIIGGLEERVDGLREEESQLNIQLGSVQAELESANSELEALNLQVAAMEADSSSLSQSQASTEAELSQLRILLSDGQADADTSEQRLSQLSIEIGGLEDERDELEDGLAELRILIGDREAQSSQLESRIAVLSGEFTEISQEANSRAGQQAGIDAAIAARLARLERSRAEFLTVIGRQATSRGIQIQVDPDGYALIIPNDVVFASGSASISSRTQIAAVRSIGQVLVSNLACNFSRSNNANCESGGRRLSTVLIEGHADTTGGEESNLTLSTRRAQTFLTVLLREVSRLRSARSFDDGRLTSRPLFGIAGYGETRNLVRTQDNVDEPRNRRIEIRLVFAAGVL